MAQKSENVKRVFSLESKQDFDESVSNILSSNT
jgi:hypothetical protein